MINSLYGMITHKDQSQIFLEQSGIEWQILMPYNSILKLPAPGEQARVYTHLYHKEDAMQIFGFSSVRERTLFLDLLKVAGIGPRQAVKILAGIEVDNFIKQLDDSDVDALTRLPGLGRKTAQKIILTLRGKLSFNEEPQQSAFDSDIINALVDMGFDRKQAEVAVRKAYEENEANNVPDEELEKIVFRKAIILLSS